jgi:hypothetical protein
MSWHERVATGHRLQFSDGPVIYRFEPVSPMQRSGVAIPAPCIVPSLIGAKVEAVWQYVFQHLHGPEGTGLGPLTAIVHPAAGKGRAASGKACEATGRLRLVPQKPSSSAFQHVRIMVYSIANTRVACGSLEDATPAERSC